MALANDLARALMSARLLEDALYGHGAWTIRIGQIDAVAHRSPHEHGVLFRACFTHTPDDNVAILCENGVERSVRPFDRDENGPFCISWDMSLEEAVPA